MHNIEILSFLAQIKAITAKTVELICSQCEIVHMQDIPEQIEFSFDTLSVHVLLPKHIGPSWSRRNIGNYGRAITQHSYSQQGLDGVQAL
jgi:hypothetical protein